VRLYEYANESQLRTALIERNIQEILTQLDDLKRTLAGIVGAAPGVLPGADTIVLISPDDVSPFAIGFYAREFGSGRPYRWTGDGNIFEFRIHLNRNCEWKFVMHADPANGVDIQAIKGFVDYAEVHLQVATGTNEITGTVPRKLFSNQVVLSFFHPQNAVPSQTDPSNADNRPLCLAFYEMKLSPEFPQTEVPKEEIQSAPQARKGRRHSKTA
jgi:hypothetical protein